MKSECSITLSSSLGWTAIYVNILCVLIYITLSSSLGWTMIYINILCLLSRYSKLFYTINTYFSGFILPCRILLPLQLSFISHVARYAPSSRQLQEQNNTTIQYKLILNTYLIYITLSSSILLDDNLYQYTLSFNIYYFAVQQQAGRRFISIYFAVQPWLPNGQNVQNSQFFCTIYDRIINVSCASLTPFGVIYGSQVCE